MLFNSAAFLLFLPIVFITYWALQHGTARKAGLQVQNALLLAASYLFYGWWDWRFLSLIAFSSGVDFFVGQQIERDQTLRNRSGRRWLWLSIGVNLGLLAYFKYANFFIENWITAWESLGVRMHLPSVQVVLPVGISFYTFQTLSYSIDIYRKRLKPCNDPIAFAAFVSFFPQLVAGPIERASSLLPQIAHRRKFDPALAWSGIRLMVWGMFKKVVVADTCAVYANEVFANYGSHGGWTLMMGAFFFAIQIYGDFSGYSDIAIGTARLFGIRLMTNFKMPYFARDIAEFWRRWHISLSTWFRDYLYIPLGGSRVGRWKAVRNTFIIFLVSGFWHGANWTFIAWGGLHALLFMPLLLRGRNRRHVSESVGWPTLNEWCGMAFTFATVTVAWVFFRSPSVADAVAYIGRAANFSPPFHAPPTRYLVHIALLLGGEFLWRFPAAQAVLKRPVIQHTVLGALLLFVFRWFGSEHADFIYFQF